VKIDPTTIISAKNTEITLFREFDPTAMTYAKKTKVTFFRENWPDVDVLDGENPRLRFLVKIDPTTMI
jgi:hypothetical protein